MAKKKEPAHALLSASGSSRWLICTPSARLEEPFPNTSSTFAEEGTAAHEVSELTARYFLNEITEPAFETMRDKLAKGPYYNAEMQEYANDYARLILGKVTTARAACEDSLCELEAKSLDFSKWAPAGFGTGDCIIVSDGWLEIIDLKYGKGQRVDAVGNPQMRLYALGAIVRYSQLYDIENVRMTIYQPRLSGVQSSDEISVADLLDWAETYVKPRAKLAYNGKGKFAPGEDTCKFCKARETCKARAKHFLDQFDAAPEFVLLTPDEAGAILKKAAGLQTWLADLENLVSGTLLGGKPVIGWKLVEGRSNRRYADELKVAETLKAAGIQEAIIYKPKELITLTQLEKDLGKKTVAETLGDLIVKPAGKPTLAPESDKRPAYQLEAEVLKAFDE